jgi:hypothetical protein
LHRRLSPSRRSQLRLCRDTGGETRGFIAFGIAVQNLVKAEVQSNRVARCFQSCDLTDNGGEPGQTAVTRTAAFGWGKPTGGLLVEPDGESREFVDGEDLAH